MSCPRDVGQLLQELIRIPSVNPDGDPGTDQVGEGACAQYVADFLRECGAEVALQEVEPGRPNVIGRFHPGSGKPRLVLAPHLDTVSVRGMTIDPFGGVKRDGRIYGRGASDTKGSVAVMLMALAEMRDRLADLDHEIWFAGLMGEEAGQDGARAFVREHRVEFAVVGEPTGLQIVHAHKGAIWVTLTTQGVAAHASAPEQGVNAIYRMHDVITFLREEIIPELATFHDDALGHPTLSVGTITGGSKVNIVPDRCRIGIDIRTVPGQTSGGYQDALIRRLEEMFPDLEVEAREAQALQTPSDHPMIGRLEKAGGSCVGAPWFCDAAIFSQAGMPAVAVGPGSIAQAHTKNEWIYEKDLEAAQRFFSRFLGFCG